jgi:hypothetical protein
MSSSHWKKLDTTTHVEPSLRCSEHVGRRRVSRGLGIALILGACLALSVAPPALAAPNNDEVSGAVLVPGVPFSDTSDTTGATEDVQGDSGCGDETVWYRFTPQTDGLYRFDTFGTAYDTTLAIWSFAGDEQNSRSLLDCNNDAGGGKQSAITFQLSAGATYLIEVGTGPFVNPGTLVFHADFAPALDFRLTVDAQGKIGVEPGTATVSGTSICSTDAEVVGLFGTLTQRQGKKVVSGVIDIGFPCPSTQRTWTGTVVGNNGAFVPGTATFTVSATACDQYRCDDASVNRTIKLRR